eukprot:UN05072
MRTSPMIQRGCAISIPAIPRRHSQMTTNRQTLIFKSSPGTVKVTPPRTTSMSGKVALQSTGYSPDMTYELPFV